MTSDFSRKKLEDLDLPPEILDEISLIHNEISEAYREDFIELRQVIREQASTLNRIQHTLSLLVEHLAPKIADSIPAVVRPAGAYEKPDLASALVVSDPIGAGFTLTQSDVARALNLSVTDVSVLVRAFRLDQDERCAVVVRRGRKRTSRWVNYNALVLDLFQDAVAAAVSKNLKPDARSTLRRVRAKLKKNKS